jgi:hypothetical protein
MKAPTQSDDRTAVREQPAPRASTPTARAVPRVRLFAVSLAMTLACVPAMLASCGPVSEGGLVDRLLLDSMSAQMQRLAAERDSALHVAGVASTLLLSLDSTLAQVNIGSPSVQMGSACANQGECASQREIALRDAVQKIVGQLKDTQKRLAAAQTSAALDREDSTMKAQAAQLQAVVEALTQTAALRLAQLDSLRTELESLETESEDVSTRVDSLTKVLASLRASDDSVFMLAKPRDQLITLGAAELKGGTFLTFGFGKTLVPVANPSLSGWSVKSRVLDTIIPLPKVDKWYALVSAHPLAFITADHTKGTLVKGKLHITSPQQFWGTSRYLIFEEK